METLFKSQQYNKIEVNIQGETYSFWADTEVAGWGTTVSGSVVLPTVLQKAQVFPVSESNCKLVMGSGRIKPGMICAAGVGTDTCQVGGGGRVGFLNCLCAGG